MEEETTLLARWFVVIAALSTERGWNLSSDDSTRYLLALRRFLPETCTASELRRICGYYHADHQFVEALCKSNHPLHNDLWIAWIAQAAQILRSAGLAWSTDTAVDCEDLAQIAQMALVVSLPTFTYRSRFSTWAHTVVVQSVQRHIRDSLAKKRAQRPDSLDAMPEFDTQACDEEQPEQQAVTNALRDQVNAILIQEGDERLAQIFARWAVADQTTIEIGSLVHLHPSRVRTLLSEARTLLKQHPTIQTWPMN
jgi:RNA polymerase sigma factor (sigma-70 family)